MKSEKRMTESVKDERRGDMGDIIDLDMNRKSWKA